jgi:hypothetical protein
MFDHQGGCRMSGLVEVKLEGSRTRLIVRDVSEISPPA